MFQLNCCVHVVNSAKAVLSFLSFTLLGGREKSRVFANNRETRILEREMFLQHLIDFLCLTWFCWIPLFQSSIKKVKNSEL